MKLTLQLVTYNSQKYIPYLFRSLRAQTYIDWELLILDNGSVDKTVEIVQNETKNITQCSKIIISTENSGFAGGHNHLFKQTSSEFILLLSNDVYLLPDCIEKLITFLDNHPDVSVVAPRIMKWNFEILKENTNNLFSSFTNHVDSLGLKVFRNRRVTEWYQREDWKNINYIFKDQQSISVFGVSGALPVYRRSILESINRNKDIFDHLFAAYKEDVDLAFRLRQAGLNSRVVLDALAYHDRQAAGSRSLSDWSASWNKMTQSSTIKYYSYRNHLMMLYKNEYWQNTILDFPWIFWYELKKFVYFLLFDRAVLTGLIYIWGNRAKLKESRIRNKELRKVGWKKMRRWWT